jgi:hypothetical protein
MFKIGDTVVRKATQQEGKVIDILTTSGYGYLYVVELESGERHYGEGSEYRMSGTSEYHVEVDHADNVIIVRLLDANGNEVARGHGHIIHEGAIGIAQAVSYASRRVLYVLDDKQPEGQKIYAKGENNYGFNTVRKNPATYERSRFNNSSRCL